MDFRNKNMKDDLCIYIFPKGGPYSFFCSNAFLAHFEATSVGCFFFKHIFPTKEIRVFDLFLLGA